MKKTNIIDKLKDNVNYLFSEFSIIYNIYIDKKSPKKARILSLITICYTLSPIDLIPDFIPILGYIDDIVIVHTYYAYFERYFTRIN